MNALTPHFKDSHVTLYNADVLEGLAAMPTASVQCVVTSPPYWGLRDYGVEGQIGLEKTPEEYIEKMVTVFQEVQRVLKDDGILWLNMGDKYANPNQPAGEDPTIGTRNLGGSSYPRMAVSGNIKPKDLYLMPHRLALALQADGWFVRADNVWAKPNPMPESVTDRTTRAHEYVFQLTKSQKYFYNADAIRESPRGDGQNWKTPDGWDTSKGNGGHGNYHKNGREKGKRAGISKDDYNERKMVDRTDGISRPPMTMKDREYNPLGRNKTSVWSLPTARFPDAHFATFPPELARICILAGSRPGDIVLDPFAGSGTALEVAVQHQRKGMGIELNADYCELIADRFKQRTIEFPLVRGIKAATSHPEPVEGSATTTGGTPQ